LAFIIRIRTLILNHALVLDSSFVTVMVAYFIKTLQCRLSL